MRWKVKFHFWTDQKLRNSLCGFHSVSNKCNSQRNSILDVTDRENDELYDLEPADPLQNGHLILSINNQRETMVKKKKHTKHKVVSTSLTLNLTFHGTNE